MADFGIALKHLLDKEGKYANVPGDNGKETYCGIARKFWPGWAGWEYIDKAKKRDGFPKNIEDIPEMPELVRAFYYKMFWFPDLRLVNSQKVTNMILGYMVNMGSYWGVKLAQRTVGIDEDGIFGEKTLKAINKMGEIFCKEYKEVVDEYYKDIVKRNPSQEKFLNGWLNREKI